MANNEQTVRDAALALKTAIAEAVVAGYRVEWPGNVEGLDKIAISETAKVKPAETALQAGVAAQPRPVFTPKPDASVG